MMINQYMELLKNPPADARSWTRWWWYGCAVTKEEITRHLSFMRDANIGGVEIQVVYPLHRDDNVKGIRNIDYFSPDFFDVIKHAVDTAESFGIKVDFTPGSFWPFGGPVVTREMAPQSAIPIQIDVCGPRSFSFDFTTRICGDIVGAVMGKMEQGCMIEETIRDIREKIKPKYLYSWPWGEELKELEIPEGDWKIVAFVVADYRQTLPAPGRNAGGYAIDHCRKDIAQYFFNTAVGPLVEKIGRGRLNGFFCDSIEVAGHNWTEGLFDEFKKRRGYDLKPYIYALWGEVGNVTPHIRYDYYKTMSELTVENFFEEFGKWCRENGSKSRIQAHGTWGDILKAYAAADIPEGETFGENDRLAVNTIHRRLPASAGHLYGKNIISNESFTWLRMPRFKETLENMKAAVDAIFLDGMNMIVNHGYSYTPESAGKPGWAFYASSHICHTNTWWPYYRNLSEYIQRVSAFLRLGRNVAEVGIYLPQADVWSENQMGDLHLAMKLEEYIGRDVADKINKAGYWFDYLNDEALTSLGRMEEEGLVINDNAYKVIILPEVKRLPLDTIGKLTEFVENGGILIAAGCIPSEGCGLLNAEDNSKTVRESMQRLFGNSSGRSHTVGKGIALKTDDKYDSLIEAVSKVIIPDAKIVGNDDCIGYIHRRVERKSSKDKAWDDIYFISNISDGYKETVIEFKNSRKDYIILDPMNGIQRTDMRNDKLSEGRTCVNIGFEPYESVIIIFSEEVSEENAVLFEKFFYSTKHVDLSEGWEFSVPAKKYSCHMDEINTWESIQELKHFTGQGIYKKTVHLDKSILEAGAITLEFEKVGEVAEVWVNGIQAGVLWKAPRKLDIREQLREGKNEIVVKVVNLWINAVIGPDWVDERIEGAVIEEWPYFSDVINHTTKRRLNPWRERNMVLEPLPSGLGGKVTLSY